MVEGASGLERRSVPARLGVSLLNLLTPGLGLLRLGHARAAFAWALASLATLGLVWVASAHLPILESGPFRPIVAALLIASLVLWFGPIVQAWRLSGYRLAAPPRWTRWYSLLIVAALFQLGSNLLLEAERRVYRPFFIPSEAMQPTLLVGERFVADMRANPNSLRRGDLILLRVRNSIYVKRLIGLPGDRVEMRGGMPVINGRMAVQKPGPRVIIKEFGAALPAKIIEETLPGGGPSYRIIDLGVTSTDDMAEIALPPGRLFVLGDNRDRSADSRVRQEEGGVELLPVEAVIGRPLFKTWTADWRWLGTSLRGAGA